jgi:hypothetical protein
MDALERLGQRAVLIQDEEGKIVGKLNLHDILRGLEPNYKSIGDLRSVSVSGFSLSFIQSMLEDYRLWDKPLADICGKGAGIKVKELGYIPIEDRYIREHATLDEAVHHFIVSRNQILLVTGRESDEVVGVLRLDDVFIKVWDTMKTCEP